MLWVKVLSKINSQAFFDLLFLEISNPKPLLLVNLLMNLLLLRVQSTPFYPIQYF
jgi:hypothetical protein